MRKYRRFPRSTMAWNESVENTGSDPEKPPIAMAGTPSMMNGAASRALTVPIVNADPESPCFLMNEEMTFTGLCSLSIGEAKARFGGEAMSEPVTRPPDVIARVIGIARTDSVPKITAAVAKVSFVSRLHMAMAMTRTAGSEVPSAKAMAQSPTKPLDPYD